MNEASPEPDRSSTVNSVISFVACGGFTLWMWLWFGDFDLQREGWDHPLYFGLGLPMLVALCLLLAMALPQATILWALAPGVVQFSFLLYVTRSSMNLWPLTIAACAILSIAAFGGAACGHWLRVMVARRS